MLNDSIENFVGDGITAINAKWTFGGNTPEFFDNHVEKSVPYYLAGHELILALSDFFINPDSICYELGCSTGLLTRKLAQRHATTVAWIGIDIEENMIKQAKKHLTEQSPSLTNIKFVTGDIKYFSYEKSDFIVAYYTMQFVSPRYRQILLDRIYETLNWGGAFLLFEKVRSPDARFQDIMTGLYTDYKLHQGYKSEEIIAKSRSLKGVLEPFSTAANFDLLKRAGFTDVMIVFKYLCFEGIFCIK